MVRYMDVSILSSANWWQSSPSQMSIWSEPKWLCIYSNEPKWSDIIWMYQIKHMLTHGSWQYKVNSVKKYSQHISSTNLQTIWKRYTHTKWTSNKGEPKWSDIWMYRFCHKLIDDSHHHPKCQIWSEPKWLCIYIAKPNGQI